MATPLLRIQAHEPLVGITRKSSSGRAGIHFEDRGDLGHSQELIGRVRPAGELSRPQERLSAARYGQAGARCHESRTRPLRSTPPSPPPRAVSAVRVFSDAQLREQMLGAG
jgi:hypothetical protein